MRILSNQYVRVYTHKGYDICTLRAARTSDSNNYVVDDINFENKKYTTAVDAIDAINSLIELI